MISRINCSRISCSESSRSDICCSEMRCVEISCSEICEKRKAKENKRKEKIIAHVPTDQQLNQSPHTCFPHSCFKHLFPTFVVHSIDHDTVPHSCFILVSNIRCSNKVIILVSHNQLMMPMEPDPEPEPGFSDTESCWSHESGMYSSDEDDLLPREAMGDSCLCVSVVG